MLSAVELEGGLCLVTATHRGVMPILLRSSRRTAELCRYYYEARDAQGSYADITTKLATQCGVLPILASTKHIALYMV